MSMNYQDFVLDLLSLLARRGPIAGLGIVKELGKKHPLYASRSTIYPYLNKLEEQGLIVSSLDPSDTQHCRRLYDISEKGKRKRVELTSESRDKELDDGLEPDGGDPATARVIANVLRREPVGRREK